MLIAEKHTSSWWLWYNYNIKFMQTWIKLVKNHHLHSVDSRKALSLVIVWRKHLISYTEQVDKPLSGPWHYDCGVELTSEGDYGRTYYKRRISLHSQYLLLFVNFSAFCVSLYTQKGVTEKLSGPVITPTLSIRHYCLGQLQTLWSHIQVNLNITLEEASHLIMRTLLRFLQVQCDVSYN